LAIAKSGSHIISIVSRFAIPPRSNSATGKRRHQRRGHPPRGRPRGYGRPYLVPLRSVSGQY